MFYPTVTDNQNTRESISQWLGYNHNYSAADGEMYDMKNLSSDNYPLMSPRSVRPVLFKFEKKIRGILYTDETLAYFVGQKLYFGNDSYDFSQYIPDDDSDVQLLKMGAYILIFPAGAYLNTANTSDMGYLGSSYTAGEGVTVTYSISDSSGNALDAQDSTGHTRKVITSSVQPDVEADEISDGDYWINTSDNGLYMYSGDNSRWTTVPTTYVKITVPGSSLSEIFNVGDAVTMNTSVPDINEGSIIVSTGDDFLVVIGMLPGYAVRSQETDSSWRLKIERRIPTMDYVCESNNRIWGCYYGIKNGVLVNEIYASKPGDPKNFYAYGTTADSAYSLSIGSPGAWTGCIEYGGYPTFFKENVIYKIFGRYPSEYQLVTINARGVQQGSAKSLAICGEYLIYKSVADICVFDGSTPTSISAALGRDSVYYAAVGGSCLSKYYISMTDQNGEPALFVYDLSYNIWYKEDDLRITQFTSSNSGQMYGASSDNQIYGFGVRENVMYLHQLTGEEYVEWMAETGDMGMEYPDRKLVNRLTLRAYIPIGSEINVEIRYDDGQWELVDTLRGDGTVNTQTCQIWPTECDHFRLRLSGHGDMRIYKLSRTLDTTSEG